MESINDNKEDETVLLAKSEWCLNTEVEMPGFFDGMQHVAQSWRKT